LEHKLINYLFLFIGTLIDQETIAAVFDKLFYKQLQLHLYKVSDNNCIIFQRQVELNWIRKSSILHFSQLIN